MDNSQRDGNTRPRDLPLEKSVCRSRSKSRSKYAGPVRTGHGIMDWFKVGKGVYQAVYCHLAYLSYMQSTSCEMLGWMKHKLESRLLGEISITSDKQITPPYGSK